MNHMNIPSERLLREAEVGETLKQWEHPDSAKHLTGLAADGESEKQPSEKHENQLSLLLQVALFKGLSLCTRIEIGI